MDKSNIQALYVLLEFPKEFPMGKIIPQLFNLGDSGKNCDIPTSQSARLGLSDEWICVCSGDRFRPVHRTHTQWQYTAHVYTTFTGGFEKQIP